LYEVLAPGYQSPLTKTQIAELFRAGRLGRDHRCKQLAHKEWRTIDELFPLLKYQSVAFDYDEPRESADDSVRTWHLILGSVVAMSALAALWYYFGNHPAPVARNRAQVTETRSPRTTTTLSSSQAVISSHPKTQLPEPASEHATSPASHPELPNSASTTETKLVEQRPQAADQQRQQAAQARLLEERARQEEKARGQDAIIELDQYHVVNVGRSPVTVKIHDNDVTSFDVWINGGYRREVPKQKGITQSGTDETLIYDSGRARLYYVWEISGKVNYCRVRVRKD
jgi:hypothetical protein